MDRGLIQTLTIYYDGHCPVCLAEILFLRSRNRANLLRFVDIQDPHFDESEQYVSCEQALATIHGRLGDGELVSGVRVFAEAYRRVGFKAIASLLSVAWLQPVFNVAYRKFARHRHALSQRIGPLLLTLAKHFCKAGAT
jgi:predicted DCC family thiol-disulfide oxidoreductase YuxK